MKNNYHLIALLLLSLVSCAKTMQEESLDTASLEQFQKVIRENIDDVLSHHAHDNKVIAFIKNMTNSQLIDALITIDLLREYNKIKLEELPKDAERSDLKNEYIIQPTVREQLVLDKVYILLGNELKKK